MAWQRGLLLLFGVPFFVLLAVVLAPKFNPPVQGDGEIPHVSRSDPFLTTRTLRETAQDPHLRSYRAPTNRELLEEEAPLPDEDGVSHATAIDTTRYPTLIPAPIITFPGMALPVDSSVTPPDTSGEMGRDYYVQAVNMRLQVFDRLGNSVMRPIDVGTVWADLGLPCAQSQGDPSVLYDQFAGRWLITQPILASASGPDLGVCMAVSEGEDPTGNYFLYYFPLEGTYIYDYPMFSIWHNGYYMTANRLTRSWAPAGVAFVAFERDQMLLGESAQALVFPVSGTVKAVVADADGATMPTTAPIFFALRSTTLMRIWRLFPNWAEPQNSNLIQFGDIVVAEHDVACEGCVPQPDTTRLLGSHTNGLAHEASYRDFGGHDSVILTHATSINSPLPPDRVGIRWYEVRGIKSGEYTVYQQSTYAPEDGLGRWMPAAMLDRYENMLLQYTVSSSTVYPGVRYSGRLATDPLNTLPQGEQVVMEGSGSQTGSARWGDYATIALDPRDDCTFWFANEYIAETRAQSWATVISAMRFPECVSAVTPTPLPSQTATPTAPATEIPVPATATILAPEVPTVTSTPTLVPPTATSTVVPPSPTATVTATATATSTPLPTPPRLYLPIVRR